MLEFEEIDGEFENAGELAIRLFVELAGRESASVLSLELVGFESPTSQFRLCRLFSSSDPFSVVFCGPFGVSVGGPFCGPFGGPFGVPFGVPVGAPVGCLSIMAQFHLK